MGQLFQKKGDSVNAAFEYRTAATQAPGNNPPEQALAQMGSAASWVTKAKTALAAGDVNGAVSAALVAASIDPKNVDAPKLLIQIEKSNAAEALDTYTQIALRDPTNTVAQARVAALKKPTTSKSKSSAKSTNP